MTTNTPRRPTSSPPRPTNRDDLPKRPRPSSPTLSGDEVALRRPGNTTEPPPNTSSRDEVTDDLTGPHINWLITPRTKAFWEHLRDLLSDQDWHTRDQIIELGQQHNLAGRTVLNLLARASKRRWIRRSTGWVCARDLQALDEALR